MTDDHTSTSRRLFVTGLASGMALLAGCSGGDDGGTTPETATERAAATDTPTANPTTEVASETEVERDDVVTAPAQVEKLGRGLVATPTDGGVLVRWRLLGTDPDGVGFTVYRDGELVTDDPITASTNYLDADGTTDSTYAVAPVVDGEEGEQSASVETWDQSYKRIPLNKPDPVEGESGEQVTYSANDATVADLTGDGTLDIVQQWAPSNQKDNSQAGHTSDVLLDGYTMDGEHLWRVNLGQNVRAGAHYTQFQVYDFDGDGRAEMAVRTSDGSVDGQGTVIGDGDADYANDEGYILTGPEYLSVFDGETGAEVARADFEPARGDICSWGDCYGNRGDRFLAATAYLDGVHPSIVTSRGYYERSAVAAWDFDGESLSLRWKFDTEDDTPDPDYEGKGAHSIATADVDADGRDEIIYGGAVVDHDGTGLHTTTMVNPDAVHCGDFLPEREGLEIFVPSEYPPSGAPSASMRDAHTGDYIWSADGDDVGRAMVSDVTPNHAGAEAWATGGVGTWSANGEQLMEEPIPSVNSAVWWTGDLHRELLDHDWQGDGVGVPKIDKWDWESERLENLRRFPETRSNNWTKGNPNLSGDILGDWREEVLLRETDSTHLRLYATPHETDHRLYTLLHDPMYRTGIARQNAGYNQPPWPSYFLGHGMADPPKPNVDPVANPSE